MSHNVCTLARSDPEYFGLNTKNKAILSIKIQETISTQKRRRETITIFERQNYEVPKNTQNTKSQRTQNTKSQRNLSSQESMSISSTLLSLPFYKQKYHLDLYNQPLSPSQFQLMPWITNLISHCRSNVRFDHFQLQKASFFRGGNPYCQKNSLIIVRIWKRTHHLIQMIEHFNWFFHFSWQCFFFQDFCQLFDSSSILSPTQSICSHNYFHDL